MKAKIEKWNYFTIILLVFSVLIIVGNSFLYINYKIKYKYEVDLIRYKDRNSAQLKYDAAEINGILNVSAIVFIYSISVLIFLIFLITKNKRERNH